MHIEMFLEEPSAEAFLKEFMPKIVQPDTTWNPVVFQGKSNLLANLESRLKGYSSWMPDDWRIVVLVDEDRQNCKKLKRKMEKAAMKADLMTKTMAGTDPFVVLNRIAVEELEAWFFGDVSALCAAYPRVPATLAAKSQFREPDSIRIGLSPLSTSFEDVRRGLVVLRELLGG